MGKAFKDGDWGGFHRAVDIAAPRYNRTLTLPFPETTPLEADEQRQPSGQ
jgi:hypothetical protein